MSLSQSVIWTGPTIHSNSLFNSVIYKQHAFKQSHNWSEELQGKALTEAGVILLETKKKLPVPLWVGRAGPGARARGGPGARARSRATGKKKRVF